MKQTIEEAAKEYMEKGNYSGYGGFVAGANSPEAKEFWQQGMYSEEDVREIATDFFRYWYNTISGTNTDEGFSIWFEEYKKKKNGST